MSKTDFFLYLHFSAVVALKKKRIPSTQDVAQQNYNVLQYDARTETARISKKKPSQHMPPSQQEYITPPESTDNTHSYTE